MQKLADSVAKMSDQMSIEQMRLYQEYVTKSLEARRRRWLKPIVAAFAPPQSPVDAGLPSIDFETEMVVGIFFWLKSFA